ncbi:MAG: phosphoribosylanthranilate isomerase [Calditrichia bacterium]
MGNIKLKICGIHTHTDLRELFKLQPDYLGFIFFPSSKRFIHPSEAARITKQMPGNLKSVGVFVNATHKDILSTAKQCNLSTIQLHGEESPHFCKKLKSEGLEIIKAFRIQMHLPAEMISRYVHCSDFFLFDSAGMKPGGNGISFDWKILESYPFDVPYFLAGGINLQNITRISRYKLPGIHALDVNSGFEIRPGEKDIPALKKLTQFLQSKNTEK